jgi:hypothetical protein
MSTDKHRIAAYLPPEVDEKFQAFKQKRGVGDSQALILILTEFLGVSHTSSLDVDALKGELLSELLNELDFRFSEFKSELLSKPLRSVEMTQESLKEVKISRDSLIDVKVSHEGLKSVKLDGGFIEQLTVAQLSERFGCESSLVRKQKSKYKDEPEKFVAWSKSRDPDDRGWKFDETAKLFVPVED